MAESTGAVSSAMTAVLREVYDAKDAWAILNYLADNPEESTRIAEATLASSPRPTAAEFALLAAKATRELAKLETKIYATAAGTPPAQVREAAKPVAAAARPAATPPPAAPATKKPPVSAAQPPITPVTAHADTTTPIDLSSDKTPTSVYMAERMRQLKAKQQRQFGRTA